MGFDLNSQTSFFNGFEILQNDLGFDQQGRDQQDLFRSNDFWTDGVVQDPNGLSNMSVSIDAITSTLINVSQGIAYSNGYRISIPYDQAYGSNFLNQTTNGICTQSSSGNKAIPLASYTQGQSNFIWARYVPQISTARTAVSLATGQISYPYVYDGYGIFVTTNNPPGNPTGLTNAVYLGTVFGQGAGNALNGTPSGLTVISKVYSTIRPPLPAVGNTGGLIIANGAVRGSPSNSLSALQREIQQGTVSTNDLRPSAVTPPKIDATQSYSVTNLTASNNLTGSASVTTPVLNNTTTVQIQTNGAVLAATFDASQNATVVNSITSSLGNINAASGKLQENGIALIPAGTQMIFYQASVPAGWSAVAINDYLLHVVSSGGGGGVNTFTSPSAGFNFNHAHTVAAHSHSIQADGNHYHTISHYSTPGGNDQNYAPIALYTDYAGTHSHGGSTGNTAPGTDSQLPNGNKFSYIDCVIGAK